MAQVVSDTNDESTPLMPINARYRWFYPIDWPQLSAVIRFRRAQGKCEGCGRPHACGVPLRRRALVRSREEAVARRTRQTTAAATRLWLWRMSYRAKLDRVQLRQGHSHTLSPPISGDRKGASP